MPVTAPDVQAVLELQRRIMPVLAGHGGATQGAVLAELLAMWIAGHRAGDKRATDRLREDILRMHLVVVRELIPVNAALIHRKDTARDHPHKLAGGVGRVEALTARDRSLRTPSDRGSERRSEGHALELRRPRGGVRLFAFDAAALVRREISGAAVAAGVA